MPSPFEHLSLASSVVGKLPLSASSRVAFLVGSLCPDVDKIAGFPRATTHWWVPGDDVSGVLKLIASSSRIGTLPLDGAMRAFVAGYLCHLVSDEQWTLTIYRPFFGLNSKFKGGQAGADRQWALHATLDEVHFTTGSLTAAFTEISTMGELSDWETLIPTIPRGDAVRFVNMVIHQAGLPDAPARYRYAGTVSRKTSEGRNNEPEARNPRASASQDRTGRQTVVRPTGNAERLESFLSDLERLTIEVLDYVPADAISDFRTRAVEESFRVCEAYLAGAPVMPPAGTVPPSSAGGTPARSSL
ncbi:MAG: hypothetical protein EXR45_07170 [Chloroflexi bacterium]|nr:hypothetical protein [Chloroflexota bacterium]